MPSLWEGLSMSLLEALSMGKAVVVSRIPSMTAVLTEGQEGELFEAGNAADLTETVARVLAVPEKRRLYGAQARETSRRYSIEHNIDQLISCTFS